MLLKLRVDYWTPLAKHFLEIVIVQVSELLFETTVLSVCISFPKLILIDKFTLIVWIEEPSQLFCQRLHAKTHGNYWIFLIMVSSAIRDIEGCFRCDNLYFFTIDLLILTKERPEFFRDLNNILTIICAHQKSIFFHCQLRRKTLAPKSKVNIATILGLSYHIVPVLDVILQEPFESLNRLMEVE